ncbi:HlyD family type I secretion periplasmic adaptor subunit [Uliginosibacterium sp. sgz301328]|uniref:HlyD family type I secretion periplasmic adaptor subunit n=1 Tax=Uliginosibacterium sp. sgz301328 TaxID=3243764 RepID=UPI00359D6353
MGQKAKSGTAAAPNPAGGPSPAPSLFLGSPTEAPLPRASTVVWIVACLIAAFLVWAACFSLDEVSTGTGKIIPSSKEQVIQSQEGGILVEMLAKEGDIVERGQVIAQLDRTRSEAVVQESAAKLYAAEATAARLSAEVNGTPLKFPPDVAKDADLVRSETRLYDQRRQALATTVRDLENGLSLVRRELSLTEPLVAQGAASPVEVLRLKRQVADLESKRNDARSNYYVKAREELAKANAEVEAQRSVTRGRQDSLTRLTFTSPVKGVVKDIPVTTLGGVIAPNGKLMEIVPLDDKLLVEARISPRDVAFIHPGQDANVKVTAYDYSIYGGLHGKVTMISPDTIQDEVKRDVYYYRVYIRTDADHLVNKRGKVFPIVPGMITTVDIHTGRKTVLDYLIKPLNRGREALRER